MLKTPIECHSVLSQTDINLINVETRYSVSIQRHIDLLNLR